MDKIYLGKISFSEKELKDLILAWLAISLAFAVMMGGLSNLFQAFFISSLTVGVGFIFHELGHKVLAQKYGAWAEFRAFKQMLLFAVLFAFLFGFAFAAPGAVFIQGRTIGRSRNGKISAAGPAMNFILAIIFLLMGLYFSNAILQLISNYGVLVNAWLGLFNLIPFAMFDGKKIWNWNRGIYFSLVLTGLVLIYVHTVI